MSYISEKMALSAYDPYNGASKSDYGWIGKGDSAKCGVVRGDKKGQLYTGGLTTYPCTGSKPSDSGWGGVLDFGKSLLAPAQQEAAGPAGVPSSSFTSSGMVMPAVVVVGGLALILLLRKK